MLKKFLSVVCVAALSTVFVGCEPGDLDGDATPDVVETTGTDVVVPVEDATLETTDPVVEPVTN